MELVAESGGVGWSPGPGSSLKGVATEESRSDGAEVGGETGGPCEVAGGTAVWSARDLSR